MGQMRFDVLRWHSVLVVFFNSWLLSPAKWQPSFEEENCLVGCTWSSERGNINGIEGSKIEHDPEKRALALGQWDYDPFTGDGGISIHSMIRRRSSLRQACKVCSGFRGGGWLSLTVTQNICKFEWIKFGSPRARMVEWIRVPSLSLWSAAVWLFFLNTVQEFKSWATGCMMCRQLRDQTANAVPRPAWCCLQMCDADRYKTLVSSVATQLYAPCSQRPPLRPKCQPSTWPI